MNENISENIEVVKESTILKEAAEQSAVNNPVEQETPPSEAAEINPEHSPETTPSSEKKEEEKKPPHPRSYYEAFANTAHTAVDKLYETLNEFIIPAGAPINKQGLKKRLPEDFNDMVTMLAQQMEVSQVEIKGWIAWLLYGQIVISNYAGLIKDNMDAVKEWKKELNKNKKPEDAEIIKTETPEEEKQKFTEPVQTETISYRGRKKRGNPHRHGKDCECLSCEKLGINAFAK